MAEKIRRVYHSPNGGSTESAKKKRLGGPIIPICSGVRRGFEDLSKAAYGTWSYEVSRPV
jgi:hypothetical protein